MIVASSESFGQLTNKNGKGEKLFVTGYYIKSYHKEILFPTLVGLTPFYSKVFVSMKS
jgi:hypothetical protein